MLSPIQPARPILKQTVLLSSQVNAGEPNNGQSTKTKPEITEEIEALKDLVQNLRLQINSISSTLDQQIKALQGLMPKELIEKIESTHKQVEAISERLSKVQSSQSSSQDRFSSLLDKMKGRFQGWLIGVGAISSILSVAIATAIQNLINQATLAAQKVLPQNVVSSTLLNLISTNPQANHKEQANS